MYHTNKFEYHGIGPVQFLPQPAIPLPGLLPHEAAVVGTYVDPSVVAGFRYRVRPLDAKKSLFGGRALTLLVNARG